MIFQKTIKKEIHCNGFGIHNGKAVSMKIMPAKVDYGINFIRTDLKNKPIITAKLNNVFSTYRSTKLKNEYSTIITVEHFLAACFALSISNLNIEIDSEELPILDGSSKKFLDLFLKSGLKTQQKKPPFSYIKIKQTHLF